MPDKLLPTSAPVPDNSEATTKPIDPIPTAHVQSSTSNNRDAPASPSSSSKKKWGFGAAVIAAIAVLAAGSAAAYYAVAVPNKPENILKKAVSNTLSQKKVSFVGKLSYESTDPAANIKAVNVTFAGNADTDTNAFSTNVEVTASGIKVPVELRHVNNNLYVKIGDLGSLKGLIESVSPTYAPTFEMLNKRLANQWLEIDQTLLKQTNTDCALSAKFSLSKEDITLLEQQYEKVPFASLKGSSDDKVNGHNAIKYEIDVDDNKAAQYFKGLQDLSLVKKIKECNGQKSNSMVPTTLTGNGTTTLTVWVDKGSKQIVKLAGKSSVEAEQKDKYKSNFEVTMQYGQATITKPDGAKPILEVLGDFRQLFGLDGGSFTNQPAPPNSVSQECLQAIQDYSNSGGTKPIPSCL